MSLSMIETKYMLASVGHAGNFGSKLFELIAVAKDADAEQLARAFPEETAIVAKCRVDPAYKERLTKEFLASFPQFDRRKNA